MMDNINQKRLKDFLFYDKTSGVFVRVKSTGNTKAGDVAGTYDRYGYITIMLDGKIYKAHRLAWLYYYGRFPIGDIDHINGIRSDNRITNLREATKAVNAQNRGKRQKNNTTGYIGVSFHKASRKYQASIRKNKKIIYLGVFDTKEDASKEYWKAKNKIHPECYLKKEVN